jgi:hypothetical protein
METCSKYRKININRVILVYLFGDCYVGGLIKIPQSDILQDAYNKGDDAGYQMLPSRIQRESHNVVWFTRLIKL